MAWYLHLGTESIRLKDGRVVGRDDFVDAPYLSKRHLTFAVDRGGALRVRDGGSRNGTRLRGEAVAGDDGVSLRDGDVLTVTDQEFVVRYHRPVLPVAAAMAGVLILSKVIDPAAAWGRAIGVTGWGLFLISALVAGPLATVIANLVTRRRGMRPFVGLAVVLALALDLGQMLVLARHTRVAERIVQARVEYYCYRHFVGRTCVQQVESCAPCARRIDKWKREIMARRIEAANLGVAIPER